MQNLKKPCATKQARTILKRTAMLLRENLLSLNKPKNRIDPFLKRQVAKFEKSLSFGNECEKLSIVS